MRTPDTIIKDNRTFKKVKITDNSLGGTCYQCAMVEEDGCSGGFTFQECSYCYYVELKVVDMIKDMLL
jgi:hypothetical protein